VLYPSEQVKGKIGVEVEERLWCKSLRDLLAAPCAEAQTPVALATKAIFVYLS